jgi:MerR family transcriptional regulator/heat shock protein HspR
MPQDIEKYEPILPIGSAARLLGVAVQTLRLYEHAGLILPDRTSSGHRMYSLHDIQKLRCIRRMITEESMNISGIKHVLAMIPCWDFKGGPDDDCLHCTAYRDAAGPCWSVQDVGNKCRHVNCRDCEVYKLSYNCVELKDVIVRNRSPKNVL